MTGQLAAVQSPHDLQLYVLTDPAGGTLWQWAAWLPHTRPLLARMANDNDDPFWKPPASGDGQAAHDEVAGLSGQGR